MVMCKSMMMGVATNIVAAWPTLPSVSSNSSHCHPADSVFNTIIIFLSDVICRSLKKITSEIECVYLLHHHLCSATPLYWLLS